jgi:hypothetical protein
MIVNHSYLLVSKIFSKCYYIYYSKNYFPSSPSIFNLAKLYSLINDYLKADSF